jgi:hypothetical protein
MTCAACGSTRVFPSRLRNAIERLRQALTEKQPYRCHDCESRKWRDVEVRPESPDVRPEDLRTGRVPDGMSSTDIDRLDPAPIPSSPTLPV